MTLASESDAARMTVLLDIRHPLATLALHPTVRFAQELDIAVDWLPLVVPPLRAPSEPGPDDDRSIRHRRSRAQAIAREIETYAAAQGLVLREYYRDPDPSAVNRGWLWVRDRAPQALVPFLEEAFRRYWALALDPSSEQQVAALVEDVGCDGAGFRAWCADEGVAAAESLASELRERGFFNVPCVLVEDEVFVGRQHLPMIRWILEGRRGPGPI